jgi:16S rRNA (guanine527-N7)-methyltransferase
MTARHSSILSFEAILAAIAPFGVKVTPNQADQVRLYISLLLKWNQTVSLTSITDPHDIVLRHFGESFYGASLVDFSHGRLADVGSGAGFPGLALKILRPELEITLIESNGRKCAFLKEIARTLSLGDVSVVQQRLEQLDVTVRAFDFVCARAFGQFRTLLQWSGKSLNPYGRLILWLGQGDAAEISAQHGWTWSEIKLIPESERRVLLVGRTITE